MKKLRKEKLKKPFKKLGQTKLLVRLAKNKKEIRQAQRLRYQVFSEEMGAKLDTKKPGFDIDKYDKYCFHLILIDEMTDKIVGTYRALTPEGASKIGGWYSGNEFDLSALEPIMPLMLEAGRACVHENYRLGSGILLLWSGLITLMQELGLEYLVGCGSMLMDDGGKMAASVYKKIEREHKLSAKEQRVIPIKPLDVDSFEIDENVELPTLIRGYLNLGATIAGTPSVDTDFNTADMMIVFHIKKANQRYLKKILKG